MTNLIKHFGLSELDKALADMPAKYDAEKLPAIERTTILIIKPTKR